MENGTRVSDITRKFEKLTTKDYGVREDPCAKKRLNLLHTSNSGNINNLVLPSKSVIKRSNAFRTEKTSKPAPSTDSYSFINSRAYQRLHPAKSTESTPAITNSANPYSRKKPYSEALNERNKIHSEFNGISTSPFQASRSVDLPKSEALTTERNKIHSDFNGVSTSPFQASRSVDLPKCDALSERNKIHSDFNGISTSPFQASRSIDLPKVFNVKPVSPIVRLPDNGVVLPKEPRPIVGGEVTSVSPTNYSTDTLRKVLNSPLPPGPPPRKPPRTFQYGFPLEESLPSTPRSRGAIRSPSKESIEARRQLFQRSKTEPTINLTKAQPAVAVHEIPPGHILAMTHQLDMKLGRTEGKRDTGLCLRSFCGLSPNKNNPIYDVPFHPARRSPGCTPPNIPINPP